MLETMPEMADAFNAFPVLGRVRFRDWDGILKLPQPKESSATPLRQHGEAMPARWPLPGAAIAIGGGSPNKPLSKPSVRAFRPTRHGEDWIQRPTCWPSPPTW